MGSVSISKENQNTKSLSGFMKEAALSLCILAVLLTMDRCLENLYFFFLYDTGKRALDLFMSLYLHAHRWFAVLIPAAFIVWLVVRRFKVNYGVLLPIVIVYLCYLITTVIAGDASRWRNKTEYPMVMILFVTMMCGELKGARRFFRIGTDLYIVLMLLNALFAVFPQLYGLFTDWTPEFFISADNLTGFPLFFGALLALLDGHFNGKNWRSGLYLALFFINQVLVHCGSSLIAAMILLLYLLLPSVKHLFEKKSLMFFTGLSVVAFALIALAAYGRFHSEMIASIVEPVFALKESIYIRFIIWNVAIAKILRKPFLSGNAGIDTEFFEDPDVWIPYGGEAPHWKTLLLGNGLQEDTEFFRRPETTLSYNAHNAYLQTIYEGGLLTMASIFVVLGITSRKMKQCRDKILIGIFSVIIFSELIMMQGSIASWFTWYPVLLIAQIAVLTCSFESVEDQNEAS